MLIPYELAQGQKLSLNKAEAAKIRFVFQNS